MGKILPRCPNCGKKGIEKWFGDGDKFVCFNDDCDVHIYIGERRDELTEENTIYPFELIAENNIDIGHHCHNPIECLECGMKWCSGCWHICPVCGGKLNRDNKEWWEKEDEVENFAKALERAGVIGVIDNNPKRKKYFQQPWKYHLTHRAWEELGKPISLEVEEFDRFKKSFIVQLVKG